MICGLDKLRPNLTHRRITPTDDSRDCPEGESRHAKTAVSLALDINVRDDPPTDAQERIQPTLRRIHGNQIHGEQLVFDDDEGGGKNGLGDDRLAVGEGKDHVSISLIQLGALQS